MTKLWPPYSESDSDSVYLSRLIGPNRARSTPTNCSKTPTSKVICTQYSGPYPCMRTCPPPTFHLSLNSVNQVTSGITAKQSMERQSRPFNFQLRIHLGQKRAVCGEKEDIIHVCHFLLVFLFVVSCAINSFIDAYMRKHVRTDSCYFGFLKTQNQTQTQFI